VDVLQTKVLVGYGMCPITKMHATGIPPHLAISNEIAELRQEVLNLRISLNEHGRKQDEGISLLYKKIEALFGNLAGEIVDVILDRVEVTGAQQVRRSDIVDLISKNNAVLVSEMRALISARSAAGDIGSDQVNAANQHIASMAVNVFNTNFQWRGEIGGRWLPEDFVFPSYATKQLWNMWYHGWAAKAILPLRKIALSKRHCDLRTKKNKTGFSRCQRVMQEMQNIALRKQFISVDTDISSMTIIASDEVFEKTFNVLIGELYPGKEKENRCEVVISTICNELVRRDGTKRPRATIPRG
jgi:hypothetical protein